MSEHIETGPFYLGQRVVVYDATGEHIIDRGTIDGEHAPVDGEWAYDVAGRDQRWDGVSEMVLDQDISAPGWAA